MRGPANRMGRQWLQGVNTPLARAPRDASSSLLAEQDLMNGAEAFLDRLPDGCRSVSLCSSVPPTKLGSGPRRFTKFASERLTRRAFDPSPRPNLSLLSFRPVCQGFRDCMAHLLCRLAVLLSDGQVFSREREMQPGFQAFGAFLHCKMIHVLVGTCTWDGLEHETWQGMMVARNARGAAAILGLEHQTWQGSKARWQVGTARNCLGPGCLPVRVHPPRAARVRQWCFKQLRSVRFYGPESVPCAWHQLSMAHSNHDACTLPCWSFQKTCSEQRFYGCCSLPDHACRAYADWSRGVSLCMRTTSAVALARIPQE